MTDDNPKKQFCFLMNINSAFEIMFPARNIQVRLALISQSCVSLSLNLTIPFVLRVSLCLMSNG